MIDGDSVNVDRDRFMIAITSHYKRSNSSMDGQNQLNLLERALQVVEGRLREVIRERGASGIAG